jgi:hypothetical protein
MTHDNRIKQEVEKTLQSLDGIARAGVNPFLFTRIKAKLQQQENNGWEKIFSFISRPAVAIAVVLVVMAINGWVIFNSTSVKQNLTAENGNTGISEIANEYNLLANATNYDYENLNNE